MLNEMKPILRAACGASLCELSLSSAASAQEGRGRRSDRVLCRLSDEASRHRTRGTSGDESRAE